MKKLENKVMLITYSDSMGHNLKDLEKILSEYFRDAVGGVHILPFFPSSGDRGFAPMDYTKVDPPRRLGGCGTAGGQILSDV